MFSAFEPTREAVSHCRFFGFVRIHIRRPEIKSGASDFCEICSDFRRFVEGSIQMLPREDMRSEKNVRIVRRMAPPHGFEPRTL